jgi:hypothetical protein
MGRIKPRHTDRLFVLIFWRNQTISIFGKNDCNLLVYCTGYHNFVSDTAVCVLKHFRNCSFRAVLLFALLYDS